MYGDRMFWFSTGLATNCYPWMRFPVHLWVTYNSLIAHLSELLQSTEVNQFTYVRQSELT